VNDGRRDQHQQKYLQEVEQDEQAVSAMARVSAAHAKTRTTSGKQFSSG
jgi:hypothetical protein